MLHCKAVLAARKYVGLDAPTASPDDPWWDEGPHIETGGRSYFVHAMGCLPALLGQAMNDHPDWYFVAAIVRGPIVELHGLDVDDAVTLGDLRESVDGLTPN